MVEESEKDTDIIKKKIGAEYKNFIKAASNEYVDKLKKEFNKGFNSYYEELNKKVHEELIHQESQQKNFHDKIDLAEKKIASMNSMMERRQRFKLTIMEKLSFIRKKTIAFRFLYDYNKERKNYRKTKMMTGKMFEDKLKRKAFEEIKKYTFLLRTKEFEERIKLKTEKDLKEIEDGLNKQKENLINLICRAEEKLKHENRKKIQTKLQLDQMVLRGISALNLQALTLSQNSLNDVVKSDYNNEIEKKYTSIIFPDTRTTLKTKKINK